MGFAARRLMAEFDFVGRVFKFAECIDLLFAAPKLTDPEHGNESDRYNEQWDSPMRDETEN